jgi:hypothetical protein
MNPLVSDKAICFTRCTIQRMQRVWVSGEGRSSGHQRREHRRIVGPVEREHRPRPQGLGEVAAKQMSTLAFRSATRRDQRARDCAGENQPVDDRRSTFSSPAAAPNRRNVAEPRFWKALDHINEIKVIARTRVSRRDDGGDGRDGLPAFWPMFSQDARVPAHRSPDPYRSAATPGVSDGVAFASKLKRRFCRRTDTVAAFIAEPGQALTAGRLLTRIREICNKHNVLLIADEVITGSDAPAAGLRTRTLRHRADIIQFAKGITSGLCRLAASASRTRSAK